MEIEFIINIYKQGVSIDFMDKVRRYSGLFLATHFLHQQGVYTF